MNTFIKNSLAVLLLITAYTNVTAGGTTPPNQQCPAGTTGTYPICVAIECPAGTTGTPPNCTPIPPVIEVPEASTLALFGLGVVVLGFATRKRQKRK